MTSQITVCQAFTSSPTLTSLSPYPETPSPPEPASPIFGVLLQVEVGASPHGHVTALEWDNEGSYTMEQGQGWVPLTPPNHGNTIWKEVHPYGSHPARPSAVWRPACPCQDDPLETLLASLPKVITPNAYLVSTRYAHSGQRAVVMGSHHNRA